ncbi:MAG: fumarate hydratase [bacterium]|jgi:fumarate hydratase subunit alpha
MREVNVKDISDALRDMAIESNCVLGDHEIEYFKKMAAMETSPTGKEIFDMMLENARISREEMIPICQDTGMTVVFLEIGQDVHLVGGDLEEAVNDGVRRGYEEGYLRKSILADSIKRVNTGDNTPAFIHTRIVPGEKVKIVIAPKGGGSENMSRFRALKPAEGIEGVKDFVVQAVSEAGGNPCPPVVVGVGLGGPFEKVALRAKQALLIPLGQRNPDPFYAEVEEELLERINSTGVGPQGLGGRITALDVHIVQGPCHIATLPVAVNLNCHATRHGERVI